MSDSSRSSPSLSERDNLELIIESLACNLSNISVNESESEILTPVLISPSEEIKEMAPPNFLKVHAETIPEFDGDVNELHFFLESINSIVTHFYDLQDANNYQNVVIYRTIISKLKGPAREVINISCASTISEIKNELIRNFSDPRNENCLSFDLNNLRQGINETPYQFHDRVRKLLNTISNYLAIHETDANTQKFKQKMYNEQALEVFLAGLRNPYGIMVRTKDPKTMLDAINFIKKEENIKYLQTSHNNSSLNHSSQLKRNILKRHTPSSLNANAHVQTSSPRQGFNPNFNYNNNSNQFRQFTSENSRVQSRLRFPTGPINVEPTKNLPPQRFPTHKQVFGSPKNVWKPNGNHNLNQDKPTPMSISTRQSTPFQRPQPQPSTSRWVSEELHNTEQTNTSEECDTPVEDQSPFEYEYTEYSNEEEEHEDFIVDQTHAPQT